AQCGNLEFLEWLYTKNIKILATAYTAKQSVRSQLILPLDEAIMHGHLEVVSWFLEKGFTPSNKNPILLNALNAGHLNVLRFFLEEYTIDYKHLNINEKRTASSVIDVNLFTELHSFLLYAVLEQFLSASNKEVKTKHFAIMDYLFEQFHTKFDINSLSAALMRLADNPSIMALKRHEHIIAWLLTNKKIKSTDLSPHDLASKPELIKNLIMLKVFNANSMLNDHTPLVHLAITTNNLDLLQYLATHHADLSIIDSAGMTVHQIALITKASEVSTWLLKEYPHNIHKKDRYNFTTLDYYRFHEKLEWFIETFTAFYGYDATINLILEHHDITVVDHLINKVTTTIDEQPKIDYPSMLLTILCENDNIQQASSILEKTTFDCEKLFYDSAIACRQRTLTFLAENIPSLCTNRIVLNKALKLTHDSSVKQYLKTLIERHHPKKTQETLEVIASRSEQLKIDKEFILKTFFTFNIKTLKTLKEETYQEELKTLFQDCAQIEHLLTEFVCSDQDSLEKILKEHG
ncbi:hypothetical protein EBS02_09640, partial [bacterium]|nr:hypothetical protein [bacterium]